MIVGMLTIFFCAGLFVYWAFRSRLLLQGTEEAVDEVLRNDLWAARQVLLALRAIFQEPTRLA